MRAGGRDAGEQLGVGDRLDEEVLRRRGAAPSAAASSVELRRARSARPRCRRPRGRALSASARRSPSARARRTCDQRARPARASRQRASASSASSASTTSWPAVAQRRGEPPRAPASRVGQRHPHASSTYPACVVQARTVVHAVRRDARLVHVAVHLLDQRLDGVEAPLAAQPRRGTAAAARGRRGRRRSRAGTPRRAAPRPVTNVGRTPTLTAAGHSRHRPATARAAGVDAVVGDRERGSGTRLAVGKPSVRPRLSPWATMPRIWNGAPRKRAGLARRRRPRPGRGCASRRRSRRRPRPARTTRVSNAVLGRAAASASPWRGGRSGSSRRPRPARAPSRSTSTWSMNSCAVCAANDAVERDHDQLARRRAPAIRSAFCSSVVSSFGADVGRDDRARVRLEGQHGVGAADHLAVADVHAVELAHGEVARRGARVGEPGDVHLAAEAYDGLERAVRRAARRGRSGRPRRAAGRCPSARRRATATPWAARRASSPLERRRAGRKPSASSSGDEPLLVGVGDVERRRCRCGAARGSRRRRGRRSASARRCPTSTRSRTPRASSSRHSSSKRVTSTSRSGSSTASPARAPARRRACRRP